MNNKGRITVFLCLLVSSFMVLALSAMEIAGIYAAKGRINMCARASVSGIKAEYNDYIFRNYHILLFDKTNGGVGEASLEEKVISNMQENLGDDYSVEDAAIADITLITDNGCEALKQQIEGYMPYAAVEYGADKIITATGGTDGTLPGDVVRDMAAAEDAEETSADETSTEENDEVSVLVDDPRDYTSSLTGYGLMKLVMPDDMELSDKNLTAEDIISTQYTGMWGKDFKVNNGFDSYKDLKKDLNSRSTWKDKLEDAGYATAYAHLVFNCATNRTNNSTALMGCEQEYLICGMDTDYRNLQGTVKQIIAVRMPVDYVYLLSDVSKMEQVETLAWSLCILSGIPEPILKYLLAGCWSYAEAVAEVRYLLEGNRMSFTKNKNNWITDLDNLKGTVCEDGVADEKGLSYEDYLMILMSMNSDKLYYRMLDLMQVNARQENEDFSIQNGATGIIFDIKTDYDGRSFNVRERGFY